MCSLILGYIKSCLKNQLAWMRIYQKKIKKERKKKNEKEKVV